MDVETRALVSVDEYLHTSYSPDCDYVDGEVLERNVGEFDHANLQTHIAAYLLTRYGKAGFVTVVEQRVQVTPTRFRVPDICLMLERPMQQIFRKPPFLAIEILSPEDRVTVMQKRVSDYLDFGIAYVWVVDPKERTAFVHTSAGSYPSKDLILRTADPEIVLPLPEIFAALQ